MDIFLDKTKQSLPALSSKPALKLVIIEKNHYNCALETH